jgi:ubiquinone/menaquinone biosynthesis C-methylase UbiE
MVTNPFLGPSVASRYARARPNLHGEAIAAFSDAIGHAKLAIDLGCGTGMSTHALVGIAESVVGMDASPDMLAKSRRAPDVSFVLGVAERLPFADRTFDFATVASAIHWFRLAAIEEVRRVLSAGGRLAVYDIRFRAEMIGVDSFGDWMAHSCTPRYPHPARNEHDLASMGFRSLGSETLFREVMMTLDELTDYLMTHSERIAAVQEGRESEAQQRAFINESLAPMFEPAPVRSLTFGITIELFRVS